MPILNKQTSFEKRKLPAAFMLSALLCLAASGAPAQPADPPERTTPIKIKIKVYLEGALPKRGAIIPQARQTPAPRPQAPQPVPTEPQFTDRQIRLFDQLTDRAAQSIIDDGLIEKAADEILDLLREALSTPTGTAEPAAAPESAQGAGVVGAQQAQEAQADCLDISAVKQAGSDRFYKALTAKLGLSAVCTAASIAKKRFGVQTPPALKVLCLPGSAADAATAVFIQAALAAGAVTPIGAASISGTALLIGLTAYMGAELERLEGEDQARLNQADQQAYNRCFNELNGSCEQSLRQRLLGKLKGKTDEAKRKTFDALIEAERCRCGKDKNKCDQECGRPTLSRPGTDIGKIRKACRDGCGCGHVECMSKAIASYAGHVPKSFIDSAVAMNIDEKEAERCACYECLDQNYLAASSTVKEAMLKGFAESRGQKHIEECVTCVANIACDNRCRTDGTACYNSCRTAAAACSYPCTDSRNACYNSCNGNTACERRCDAAETACYNRCDIAGTACDNRCRTDGTACYNSCNAAYTCTAFVDDDNRCYTAYTACESRCDTAIPACGNRCDTAYTTCYNSCNGNDACIRRCSIASTACVNRCDTAYTTCHNSCRAEYSKCHELICPRRFRLECTKRLPGGIQIGTPKVFMIDASSTPAKVVEE